MTKGRAKTDNRTLVDRLLDSIKNNHVAAVIIIASLGIGAIASLTDSTKKLSDLLSSFSNVSLAGEWKSDLAVFYPIGPEFMRLRLQEAVAGQVVGSVQFSGNQDIPARKFGLLDGKREGKKLTFSFDSGAHSYEGEGKSVPLRETVIGELVGSELHLVYQRERHGGVPVTARRVPQAAQLVEGRLAIIYKDKEYPDHRSACTQLLREIDPPEIYKQSDPPDEDGNVHCVGKHADGRDGFDMYMNEVREELICPPNSRKTLTDGETHKSLKRCECDGELVASAEQCVS